MATTHSQFIPQRQQRNTASNHGKRECGIAIRKGVNEGKNNTRFVGTENKKLVGGKRKTELGGRY